MFVVSVIFESQPEHAREFAAMLQRQAQNSLQREVDCLRFDVAHNLSKPQLFFLYEIYRDAEAFNAHLETEHFKSFAAQSAPLTINKQVQTWQLDSVTEG